MQTEIQQILGIDLPIIQAPMNWVSGSDLVAACAELEKHLGSPRTSSNHAMAWHALRLAGIDDRLGQFGSLYDLPLP